MAIEPSYDPVDYLNRLEAEVERIRSEYKLLERDYQQAASERAQASDDALRLREALQYIADWQLGEAMAARLMRDHARSVLDG